MISLLFFSLGLMVNGLAWRGGEVTLVTGSTRAANDLFNEWDANGLTARLCSKGPRTKA